MTSLQAAGDPGDDAATPEFEVVAGAPTPEELAAVTAVITSMIEELEDGQRAGGPRVSAWQRSQRSIRAPLNPGAGAWRSFSG
ncbi:hypothetical protein BH10ACT4_BH10ACT4_12910 [soil metagenome]